LTWLPWQQTSPQIVILGPVDRYSPWHRLYRYYLPWPHIHLQRLLLQSILNLPVWLSVSVE
jgi:hypothetical protein